MLQITITNERQNLQFDHAEGPIEFGRAEGAADVKRVVIDDAYVSRSQLRIKEVSVGRVRIENLGASITYSASLRSTTQEMGSNTSVELPLPLHVTAGYTVIGIEASVDAPSADDAGLMTLARRIRGQGLNKISPQTLGDLGDTPSAATLTEWFERLLEVQRSAAGSNQFYEDTAHAVVDLIGLDRCLILLLGDDNRPWEVVARYARRESVGPEFSRKVLGRVVGEKRTFFQGITNDERTQSLMGVEAVVASPVMDEASAVIGIVYGCRNLDSVHGKIGIKPLEAQFVQLLAGAVTAGLARLQKEAEAARARVQLEQFFSRELVTELERNPNLLEGQERIVTCLFADLRGFSQISEMLGAKRIYDLLHDVMDPLTDQIMNHDGVVIDYHGDGLAAMWNAPADSVGHANKACQAALAMQNVMPECSARWESELGFPLRIGIGINTGTAQVGNAGSSRRLKYGPLGPSVNLASRIEGATKFFGMPVLVTEATRKTLSDEFATRKLCRIQVVGIQEPVAVYELCESGVAGRWFELRDQYEQALSQFEDKQLEGADAALQELLRRSEFEDDTPCKILAKTIADLRERADSNWDPVIKLGAK